jgi:MFS family permease
MMTVINDRFGGLVFADQVGGADTAVSILYGAAGLGLALGMFAARRIGLAFAARDRLGAFMGWAIVASGLVFALCGTVTTVWVMGALYVVNRLILSAEYAVQETILLTSVPDSLRGKVFLLDRSIELATLTVSAAVAAALFSVLPLRSVPVISGLLMASPGLLWLAALNQGRFVVSPQRLTSSG